MLAITAVDPDSIGAELELVPGDRIQRINNQSVRDVIDFHFYMADEYVELDVLKKETQENEIYEVEKDYADELGLTVEEMKMHTCGADCIFCFVTQNPGGLRQSLYFKDGDYRFSFLQGHFVTLDNVGPKALERIIKQHLSPINISVHTTDPELRVKMLRHPQAGKLMEKLKYLADNGIELHTQIVLCRDINDGAYLKKSIEELAAMYPKVQTLSVVPVGITKFQKNIELQKRIDQDYAAEVLQSLEAYRRQYKREFGVFFVQPSDEWYLLAGQDFPAADAYEGYPQYENGVGMCRSLIDDIAGIAPYLPARLAKPRRVTVLTGTLAGPVLQKYVAGTLNQIQNFTLEILVVTNDFLGEMVTVSGLLAGCDMRRALEKNSDHLGDLALLSPYSINDDNVFLDDLSPADLQKVVPPQTRLEFGQKDTLEWFEQMLGVTLSVPRITETVDE